MLLFLLFSTFLGIDALPGSAGVFPAPGVPTTLPRSASTTRGHRAVVYSTSVDHLFYVSASARNDATLFVSVGSLFASPVFLEGPGELARGFYTGSYDSLNTRMPPSRSRTKSLDKQLVNYCAQTSVTNTQTFPGFIDTSGSEKCIFKKIEGRIRHVRMT